ncbi:Peptidase M19 [Pseudomonas syringae pv. cilantro]|uniref:Peptidase M19 n=2 Tax=Pseudomonas syringae group TaxID=136849 RepID=A0A0N0GDF6_PSESX|nr:Peptidase M19 [Pseudomonas syringae pv. cilantro]KPW73119.1 Peptidase M19 [Pseudomonas syringae pv. coriandricola]RMN06508.1 Peptidase M19 [Pseudomonas syringae pv. coriandricola]
MCDESNYCINGHRQLQPESLGQVAAVLSGLGYDAAQIDGIFGDNFLRVAQATWPKRACDPLQTC